MPFVTSVKIRANLHLLRGNTIKQSKTNPFWRGIHIYLEATNSSVYPVLGMLAYLALREIQAGPLFITEHNDEGHTWQTFSTAAPGLTPC